MRWEPAFKDYMQEELIVLITNDNGEYYYDDLMIKNPKGQNYAPSWNLSV